MDDEKYVIIAESKIEEPLVYEVALEAASYDKAHKRMRRYAADPNIIRVCVARLVYEDGNGTLLPGNKGENYGHQ